MLGQHALRIPALLSNKDFFDKKNPLATKKDNIISDKTRCVYRNQISNKFFNEMQVFLCTT